MQGGQAYKRGSDMAGEAMGEFLKRRIDGNRRGHTVKKQLPSWEVQMRGKYRIVFSLRYVPERNEDDYGKTN